MTDDILDKMRELVTIQKNEDGSLFLDNDEGQTLTLSLKEIQMLIDELSDHIEYVTWKKIEKRRKEIQIALNEVIKQTPINMRVTGKEFREEIERLFKLNKTIRDNYEFADFYDACVQWRMNIITEQEASEINEVLRRTAEGGKKTP